ncbi:FKBP-type peptidyl-prolyl cis-trans isomerase [Anaeromyxobacter oryzisoli]|jgi:FKBP-type peptidyl-prolyl cis-trans isomerase FkpA|uniref:FKBP-type peptidyl-prolyl cis-trans isomerase n=1 Tax=Anaeromyxobacter oryzisoli TaxID=2925408 RepID=UPI001F5A5344|nr:FKBP-type peptidyl-prolyl cis-trans isomerase [Anaeromyxobacter sp. SG63]
MRTIVAVLAVALAAPALAQHPKAQEKKPAAAAQAAKPQDTEKSLYAVGLAVAKSLDVFALTPAEAEKVMQGIRDGLAGKPKFQLDEKAQAGVQELARSRLAAAAQKQQAQGVAYLDRMSKQKGAVKTESGAIVIPVKPGTGATPTATDTVKVHYVGTLVDGKEFDSSVKRGQPAEFPLNGVIKCWTEALQKMKVGGEAKVVCPAGIAYGEQGRPPVIPGNAVLTFDVKLLDVVKKK